MEFNKMLTHDGKIYLEDKMVNHIYIKKENLREIVDEAPKPICDPDEECEECAEWREFLDKLKQLLEKGE